MNFPFVSIIIPVRNVCGIIGRCLKSLNELNYPKDKYEIIIADSESTDNTQEISRKYGAVVVSTPKRSVCAGRNEGFKIAKGEIIAFSDADCVMDKNWINNSLKYFKDPAIGGVGGPNITPDDETAFGKAVGFVFNQAIFSAGSIHGRILDKIKEVKSIPGCNMIFKKEVLQKVMPMDETLIEAEDYIMNQKIREFGYKLLYTPDTIVWHYRRPSPKKFLKQMHRYALGRLLIGKRDKKMINVTHIIAGLSLPILLLIFIFLAILNLKLLMYLILSMAIFLIVYFFLALFKLKTFVSAVFVPYAILLLTIGWSTGFLRELFFPAKGKNRN